MFGRLRLKPKLTLVFLGVALGPLILLSWISYDRARDALSTAGAQSESALESAAFAQLEAVAKNKAASIERYFQGIEDQVLTFSEDRMIVDAMREFRAAFAAYPAESGSGSEVASLRRELGGYYGTEFSAEYRRQNDGRDPGEGGLLARLDAEGVLLQHAYVQANPHPLGSKHLLDRAAGPAAYHRLHETYHPVVRSYLEKFGYYDIFLVDPVSGDIVYSVFKELDYATSLVNGPFADSGIGQAFALAKDLPSGEIVIIDFQSYTPSYGDPTAFLATPIIENEATTGVLIFKISIEGIN